MSGCLPTLNVPASPSGRRIEETRTDHDMIVFTELVKESGSAPTAPLPLQVSRRVPVDVDPPEEPLVIPGVRVLATDSEGRKVAGADPDLVRDDGVWRVFTTQAMFTNIPTWESTDLITWSALGDALPELPEWATWGRTWAPDVVELDGRWLLYFASAHAESDLMCIGHAVAVSAVGPYEPFDEPLVCELDEGGSIDPMVTIDRNGTPHLLWKVDANAIGRGSELRSQRLSSDGEELLGDWTRLLTYEPGWEEPLIEQPEMIEVDGLVHLFYSAGCWDSAGYQTGHALCEGVGGPCVKTTTEGGWLTSTAGVEGPGSLSLAQYDGMVVGAYHGWIDGVAPENGEFRSLVIEPVMLPGIARAALDQVE